MMSEHHHHHHRRSCRRRRDDIIKEIIDHQINFFRMLYYCSTKHLLLFADIGTFLLNKSQETEVYIEKVKRTFKLNTPIERYNLPISRLSSLNIK